ncbi:MAG TPA: RtcB family protein [Chroococcales cyanobacterium]|jgi:tRNA-splicing ligase RtcB
MPKDFEDTQSTLEVQRTYLECPSAEKGTPVRYFPAEGEDPDPSVCAQAAAVQRLPGVMQVAILASPYEDVPPSSVVLTRNRLIPGAIGLDIGCGLTLLQLDLPVRSLKEGQVERFASLIAERTARSEGRVLFCRADMQNILRSGANWLYKAGFLPEDDLNRLEFAQLNTDLNWEDCPPRAKNALSQLGSLGKGGHFLSLVEIKINDPLAKRFGLVDGNAAVIIHSGSRDFGRAIAEHHLAAMAKLASESQINLALVSAEADSPAGHAYRKGHHASANFAIVNRLLMLYQVRETARRLWGCNSWLLADHCHNLVSPEVIHGEAFQVHRKGSARSYPAGNQAIHETIWEDVGQLVTPPLLEGDIRVGGPNIQDSFFSLSPFGPAALSLDLAHFRPITVVRGT